MPKYVLAIGLCRLAHGNDSVDARVLCHIRIGFKKKAPQVSNSFQTFSSQYPHLSHPAPAYAPAHAPSPPPSVQLSSRPLAASRHIPKTPAPHHPHSPPPSLRVLSSPPTACHPPSTAHRPIPAHQRPESPAPPAPPTPTPAARRASCQTASSPP